MNLTKRQKRAEEALKFADSYTRADCILDIFLADHPRAVEMLGAEWTGCDYFPELMRGLLLGTRIPRPAVAAMTAEERVNLGAMPDCFEVFRGCYPRNRDGLSWSTDRVSAER